MTDIRGKELDSIFWAKSVAVVGASATPGKTGHTILKNILDAGYCGKVYPVNPKGGNILGIPVYPTLTSIGAPLDLGVFVVPAELVPDLLAEGARAGMKGAVVISGGFGEVGNSDLEQRLVDTAEAFGVRLIGPNCQGINYAPNRLCATWPLAKLQGPIAIVSQSGTVGAALSGWAEQEGLGISGFVGLGNKADVSELELLEFFGRDPNTRVIAMYLERIKDGRRFMRLADEVLKEKKIAVLKGGRTPEGKRAAQSHTRSVAGSYEVFSAVCRQLGLMAAWDVESLYDCAKFAALSDAPKGPRVLVVTSSGGSGILSADAITESGLSMAALTPDASRKLAEALPSRCVISNPLDLTGDATSERYRLAAEIAAQHDIADSLLFIFGDPIPGASQVAAEAREKTELPVAVVYIGGGEVQGPETVAMHRLGIPAFPTPERAVRALSAAFAAERIRRTSGNTGGVYR